MIYFNIDTTPLKIDILRQSNLFSEFDIQFALFIYNLSDKKPLELFVLTLILSSRSSQGHVGIELPTLIDNFPGYYELRKFFTLAPENQWPDILTSCSVVGKPGDFCPLIQDQCLLYLHRHWQEETNIAQKLLTMAEDFIPITQPDLFTQLLNQYFPDTENQINWQRMVGIVAASKRLCILTGGPGTGKTTTIIYLLALLKQYNTSKPFNVALAAPTGKAAVRLEQALTKIRDNTEFENFSLSSESMFIGTVHRLLGVLPHAQQDKYNATNPLPMDLVVVDEVSMMDLSLMARLLDALPADARLILVGDRDQLPSVQAGSVFQDLCDPNYFSIYSDRFRTHLEQFSSCTLPAMTPELAIPSLANCLVGLQRSYRFAGPLADCSRAIKAGKGEEAFSLLVRKDIPDLTWTPMSPSISISSALESEIITGWQSYLKARTIDEMFHLFMHFRILCVLRSGPLGVENINRITERILARKGMIRPSTKGYYRQPIMIVQNDYALDLYNGDIGIIVPDASSKGQLKAWFPGLKGQHKQPYRAFSLSRIGEYETAYAITIHKSQGSEFDQVLLLLPESDTPLCTRELIYTGITRARKRVNIYGKESMFRSAVKRKINRHSGLARKLWQSSQ